MKRKLTAEECFARAEAYEECADHLALEWTADPVEKQAGEMVEAALRIRVKKWRALGQQRTRPNAKVQAAAPQAQVACNDGLCASARKEEM